MKALVLFLALLSACSCAGTYRFDIHPVQLAALTDATVVIVEPTSSGYYRAYCSGVWIGDDLIATAAHCVEGQNLTIEEQILQEIIGVVPDALGREVLFASHNELDVNADGGRLGVASPGIVVAVDTKHDVALVRVDDAPLHHIAPLASRTMSPGEVGHIVGHPGGELYSYTPAHIAAVRETDAPYGKTLMLQVFSGAYRGNSGGGLFDQEGNLQGVCSLLLSGSTNSFFVHVKYVRKMLEGLK